MHIYIHTRRMSPLECVSFSSEKALPRKSSIWPSFQRMTDEPFQTCLSAPSLTMHIVFESVCSRAFFILPLVSETRCRRDFFYLILEASGLIDRPKSFEAGIDEF